MLTRLAVAAIAIPSGQPNSLHHATRFWIAHLLTRRHLLGEYPVARAVVKSGLRL